MDLPGDAWKGDQVIGYHDDLICKLGIGKCKTQWSAGSSPVNTVAVPELIGSRCGNYSNINIYFSILDRLVPSPM